MSSAISVVSCQNVFKTFVDAEREVPVLRGINFDAAPGEQIAIMGRSGSGKTTLLQLLGGLDTPSTGVVKVNQKNFQSLNEIEQANLRNQALGFVYQFHHLLPEFTAVENVAMPLLIAGIKPNEAEPKALTMLDKVGLAHRAEHLPSELSGGERQRVAIARAMVNAPKCILADEPTGNLDEETAQHILNLMLEINRGHQTTLIIVTHDAELASKMDRTLYLHDGHLNQQSYDPASAEAHCSAPAF